MDIASVDGRTLNEVCRALKQRRAADGFSYRTRHAGRNDPSDPSTWILPVHHSPTWIIALSVIRYLRAFPRYQDVLSHFGIDADSVFAVDGASTNW